MRPRGLKPALIVSAYAALKRRSSTVLSTSRNAPLYYGAFHFPERGALPRHGTRLWSFLRELLALLLHQASKEKSSEVAFAAPRFLSRFQVRRTANY